MRAGTSNSLSRVKRDLSDLPIGDDWGKNVYVYRIKLSEGSVRHIEEHELQDDISKHHLVKEDGNGSFFLEGRQLSAETADDDENRYWQEEFESFLRVLAKGIN